MVDLIGNKIPDIKLVKMDSEKGPQPLSVLDFCKDKKVVCLLYTSDAADE